MIEDLRWVQGKFGFLVLEAYDGYVWYPIPVKNGQFSGNIPGIIANIMSTDTEHKSAIDKQFKIDDMHNHKI